VELSNTSRGILSTMNVDSDGQQQQGKSRTGLPTAINGTARRGRGAPVNIGNRKNLVCSMIDCDIML
jgi:hypothetical protein